MGGIGERAWARHFARSSAGRPLSRDLNWANPPESVRFPPMFSATALDFLARQSHECDAAFYI